MAGKEAQAVNTPAATRVCSRCSRALAGDDGTCPSCAQRAAELPRRDAPAPEAEVESATATEPARGSDEPTDSSPATSTPPAPADDDATPAADDERFLPGGVPVGMRTRAPGVPRRVVVAILIIALAIFMGVLIANSISRTSKAERHFNTCVANPNIPECNN